MKAFLNLKLLLIVVFILNLQFTIVNQQSLNLYAQDPQLFEHSWYYVSGEIDGEEFITPYPNFEAKLNFEIDVNAIIISHPFCKEQLIGDIEFHPTENEFVLLEGTFILLGVCGPPLYDFIQMHYNIYYIDEEFPKNTFYYTIEIVDEHSQLTIENGEGDWAVYNSVLLSTPSFNETTFTIYPNPVKENLYINNTSNKPFTAIIYDVSGKKLGNIFLENSLSIIDVKAFNPGLYFVVFESEVGERVSQKFIKQ